MANEEKKERKRWPLILLIILLVLLIAGGIFAITYFTKDPTPDPNTSEPTIGDINGDPELPSDDDNVSSDADVDSSDVDGSDNSGSNGGSNGGSAGNNGGSNSGTTSDPQQEPTTSDRDNNIYDQPSVPVISYGGNDGYSNTGTIKQEVPNYDNFKFFRTALDKFADWLKSAKEFMLEPIMYNKAENVNANDYQQTITQTGQYVFQHAGVTCTNPMDAYYAKYQGNPILWGQNVYTPWILKKGDTWYVYYGGWGTVDCKGNDTSYLATTKDPELRGGYTQHGIVIKAGGSYVHAQDPSVAIGPDGKFYMAFTQTKIAYGKGIDWIGMAVSDDGIHFTAYGSDKVGIADSPDSEIRFSNYERKDSLATGFDNIGRPSLYYNENYQRADGGKGRWEMYVDGENFAGLGNANATRIHFFTSEETFPITWKYEGDVRQGGETALAVIDGTYYLAYRDDSSWPSRMKVAASTDGMNFGDPQTIITGETARDGTTHLITQMAFAVEDDQIKAIMYGRSTDGWQHKVSLAYPQKKVEAYRGSELVTAEAWAVSADTQVIASGGVYTPLTKIRVYEHMGYPAAFEAFLTLYSGQSVSLVPNDTVPGKVSIIAPIDGAKKELWGPTFMWHAAEKASSYKLELATDAAFQNIVYTKDKILIENYIMPTKLDAGKTYYWRVTASNSKGSTVGDVWSFTVCADDEVRGELIQVLPDSVTATESNVVGSDINYLSDGPYYTYWSAPYDEEEELPGFTMDYGRQYPIAQLYWLPRSDGAGNPTKLKLEYSIDGKTYYELTQEDCIDPNSLEGFESGFSVKHIRFKEPINARYIRVTVLETAYSPVAGMSEFRAMILR